MAQANPQDAAQLAVLVVDESPVARLGLCHAVEAQGHAALQARDVDEAWGALNAQTADVVLVPWLPGDARALDLVRRLRTREAAEGSYTAVIALAHPSAGSSIPVGPDSGVDGVLAVPVDEAALRTALRTAGRLARLERRVLRQDGLLARQEELLRDEVRRDPVTRLGNRLRLDEDLRRFRGRAQRYGHRATAVIVAVDYLRRYNETAGRAAGDEVLRKVAGAIRGCLRDADSAYRYAGEDLLVLLPEQAEEGGVVVAERCRAAVASLRIPHPRSDAAAVVTVSCGVAELLGGGRPAMDEWLRSAEQALDAAKAAGRNGVARAGHTRVAGQDTDP
jgi:diguanylate cyclase (GGDEF)-like protein